MYGHTLRLYRMRKYGRCDGAGSGAFVYAETIALSDALRAVEPACRSLGAKSCDNDTIAASCRYVILAVKPRSCPRSSAAYHRYLKQKRPFLL